MQISMKSFMDRVKVANSHFARFRKSSFQPVIDYLGGPFEPARGNDYRIANKANVRQLQLIIWALPTATVRKYKIALDYLTEKLKVYPLIEWPTRPVPADHKYYDGAIEYGTHRISCVVKGENHPPTVEAWGTQDDTLSRQAGHGICKGYATIWVIALLNDQIEARDPSKFRDYFTNVLKFQATYIKDFGQHMDSHVEMFRKMNFNPDVTFKRKVERTNLQSEDLPKGNWGAYVSVWQHDVSFGSYKGNWFVMDPNCGLIGYTQKHQFLNGARSLVEGRRYRKKRLLTDTIGIWFFA